ncbi:type II toxin-antitoxin system HicA family toxin [Methylocucumis oryzae]|uniref:Periplasmic or secreted lipoprotein n=1 Tax=Methylocucumis oryzae TaxID=1632867 RepID=A0A0F3IEK6_9GAMM|nr:type II toxin-antitoxin system HicA family toxin [Methylocucumis oryzae]KJV05181.1 periplasmic or secreted lipoprotein [Methylocucumis oryzae]
MKSISGKIFCKLLHLHGWQLQRIRGSHHIYTHPSRSEILTVPVHGNQDLKIGTLSKLLKDAGLTEHDF